MEYAIKECTVCGARLPANQMVKREETVEVERSVMTGRASGGPARRNVRYRTITTYRCPNDEAELQAALEQARQAKARGRLIAFIVLLVLVAGVVVARMGGQSSPDQHLIVASREPPAVIPPAQATNAPQEPDAAPDTEQPIGEDPFGSPPRRISPDTTPELATALQQALDTGENQTWEKAPYRGGLTVTNLTNDAKGRCRFATYSLTGSGEDWVSRNIRFCQQRDSSWRVTP